MEFGWSMRASKFYSHQCKNGSHIWIIRPAAAFRYNPGNILTGVFDIAGLTVNAVLCVYLE